MENKVHKEEVEVIETENRPGYYKDSFGRWRRDRRVSPERRKSAHIKTAVQAMRKRIRRQVDRQALRYIRRIAR